MAKTFIYEAMLLVPAKFSSYDLDGNYRFLRVQGTTQASD